MSDRSIAPVHNPVIKSSPLFKNLSELELNAVAAFLEPRTIKAGEVIFTEGTPGAEMFLLVSGKVNAWVSEADGTRRWMFGIKPGDFFGEMSVIANQDRSATLTAGEDTELLVFPGIDFYRIIFDHPMIGVKMLTAIRGVQNSWLEETSKYLSDLMRWGETARRRAISDDLTGLYNRRFLEDSANDRFQQGFVEPRSISLMMMDLDKLHDINTKYGPVAGDLVCMAAADVLRSTTRAGDICARLSGDEFAVLLLDTGPDEARSIAERICQTMFAQKVKVPKIPVGTGQTEVSVSTSIGIASAPAHAKNWESLYLAADNALHRSKDLGRNRVEIAGVLG
ncbi:MAG: GGDEF domain-containing protein [Treponema sp.]|nr:GGDEF domain-containing protein [Treponema sp.]